jgi:hypothetical protein
MPCTITGVLLLFPEKRSVSSARLVQLLFTGIPDYAPAVNGKNFIASAEMA